MAVQAGWSQAVHRDGEAVRVRRRQRRRRQRSLELRLREKLLPVLQVGRVHLEEGRAARVARLQHGCCWGGRSGRTRGHSQVQHTRSAKKHNRFSFQRSSNTRMWFRFRIWIIFSHSELQKKNIQTLFSISKEKKKIPNTKQGPLCVHPTPTNSHFRSTTFGDNLKKKLTPLNIYTISNQLFKW